MGDPHLSRGVREEGGGEKDRRGGDGGRGWDNIYPKAYTSEASVNGRSMSCLSPACNERIISGER